MTARREPCRARPRYSRSAVAVPATCGLTSFLLHVAVPDTDALYAFVIDRLTERREVADVRTSVVYEHLQTGLAGA